MIRAVLLLEEQLHYTIGVGSLSFALVQLPIRQPWYANAVSPLLTISALPAAGLSPLIHPRSNEVHPTREPPSDDWHGGVLEPGEVRCG